MISLYLDSLNPLGESQLFILITPNLDSAFEALSRLVASGCRLRRLGLRVGKEKTISLPVEAFDGTPMLNDLRSLQRQWEDVLATPDKNSA